MLNTSFNENEPVVCRPQEALDCFLRTKMDVLVVGSFFLERTAAETGLARTDNVAEAVPAQAYEISRRLQEGFNAEQVYLFGSYARGEAGPDSDLDFLVIVPHSAKSRYKRAVDAHKAVRDISFAKDIIVLTRAEWERDLPAVCSLASTVKREGKLLYGSQE